MRGPRELISLPSNDLSDLAALNLCLLKQTHNVWRFLVLDKLCQVSNNEPEAATVGDRCYVEICGETGPLRLVLHVHRTGHGCSSLQLACEHPSGKSVYLPT
jgi:hypothetical protein